MTRVCSGCGLHCDGRCYSECEADYPPEIEVAAPREPYVASKEYLAWCAEVDGVRDARGKRGSTRVSTERRFWGKVDKRGPDECWPWLAGALPSGYGVFYLNGLQQKAHRISWELANGAAIPSGLFACHSCDNPNCVNPAHLWLGTALENVADMTAKGRQWQQKKTHCAQGHEFTPENTHSRKGKRICRTCDREAKRRLKPEYLAWCEKIDGDPLKHLEPRARRVA